MEDQLYSVATIDEDGDRLASRRSFALMVGLVRDSWLYLLEILVWGYRKTMALLQIVAVGRRLVLHLHPYSPACLV